MSGTIICLHIFITKIGIEKLALFSVPHTAQKMRSSISNKKLQWWHL